MGILSNIFGQRPSASIESITFDASRYTYQGLQDGKKVWYLPEGGGIGLWFFGRPPDLPTGLDSIEPLKDFYAAQLGKEMQLVDCRVMPLDGVESIWLVVRGLNDAGSGSTYVGSLTIPFTDFSFVIKVQCQEQGVTGMREALLTNEALGAGTAITEGDRLVSIDKSFDDEQFDSKVPKHPLSRVRRELRHIAGSIRIAPRLKNAPRFDLPQPAVNTSLAQDFKRRWETDDDRLIAFSPSTLADVRVPPEVKAFLTTAGLPSEAAPCLNFEAPKSGTLPRASAHWQLAPKFDQYRVIGSNGSGDSVCLDEATGGEIVYLNHDNDFERVLMASSIFKFAESLLAVRNFIRRSGGVLTPIPAVNVEALIAELREIDPAVSGDDGFWPLECSGFTQQ